MGNKDDKQQDAKILKFRKRLPRRRPGVANAAELGEAAKLALQGNQIDDKNIHVKKSED